MSTVDDLITEVLKKEGSQYTNDPLDSGGPTKYGITQKTLSVCLHHPATAEQVAALTESQARVIYTNLYYTGPGIQHLPIQLQGAVFDFGVNAGPGAAIEALQTVLNMAGFECKEDGLLGPETVKIVDEAFAKMGPFLLNAFCDYRCWFYEELVKRKPSNQKYLKGWLNRANSFRATI